VSTCSVTRSLLNYPSTCVSSIFRIVYIYIIFYTTYDITWVAGIVWLWTGIEANLGVICASVPALKVYFQKYLSATQFGTALGSSFGSTGNRTKRNASAHTETAKSTRRLPTLNLTGKSRNTKSGTQRNSISYADKDLELGSIAITREVEIESTYGDADNQSSQYLQGPKSPSKDVTNTNSAKQSHTGHHYETPWLDDKSLPSSPLSWKKSKE
jgi:hypothetical protein